MRHWWTFGVVAALVIAFVSVKFANSQGAKTIRISGAFAIYPLTVRWAEEFRKEQPDVRFDITAGGAGKGVTDALAGLVDIGMVSREPHPEELQKGAVFVPVAKDAVVATINAQNPVRSLILRRGVTREILKGIFVTQRIKTWGQVVGIKDVSPIHAYTRADACGAAETWAKFLIGKEGKQEDLKGTAVSGDPGVAEAVRRDPLGIGYNNINYAYNPRTGKPFDGLLVVPLDLNGNGKLDKAENFYSTRQLLLDAIADGRYPQPPARMGYFVTKGKPRGIVAEFIRWVLTKGQKFVSDAGYVPLSRTTIDAALRQLR